MSPSASVAAGMTAPTFVPAAAFSATLRVAVAALKLGTPFASVVAETLDDHALSPEPLVARTR